MANLTAARALADWQAALDRQGETIEIGRQTGNDPSMMLRVPCRARVKSYAPQPLVGEIKQGAVVVRAFYPDLVDNAFPLPVRNSDNILVRGQQIQISAVDNNTGRIGDTQIFVKLLAVG